MPEPLRCQNFIAGRWQPVPSAVAEVRNPATGSVVTLAPQSESDAVDQAVTAAAEAWQRWRWVAATERANHLHRLAEVVETRLDEIARSITLEQGKPLNEARGEVAKFVKALHFYAEEAVRIFGSTIPNDTNGFLSIIEKEPIGVVAGIAAWNYPVELIGWKLAGALAAGCSIVIKPSEYTPGSAFHLFRCIEEAGIPDGVANLVFGAGKTGQLLAGHPEVAKVAFTGSRASGESLYRTITGITGITLELGGSCPLIVTSSANVDAAVAGALRRSFRNAGQICIAINRIYVADSLYESFVDRLAEGAAKLTVADGLAQPDADVGPITTDEVVRRTTEHVRDARDRGGVVMAGGEPPAGRFLAPTVVADASQEASLMHEETFGPAVGVSRFSDLDEAIRLANSTPAGLASYVYANDLEEIFSCSRRLDFGNVAVNNVDAGIINAPYGGRKQSGSGYEHGREGMESYLQLKHVRIRHGV